MKNLNQHLDDDCQPKKEVIDRLARRKVRFLLRNHLIRVRRAREIMNVSQGHIYNMIARGELPVIDFGDKCLRVTLFDVMKVIRKRRRIGPRKRY